MGSVIELLEEMECYLSFPNEDVFQGVAFPEETPIIPPKEVTPQSTQPTPASTPIKKAMKDMTMEPIAEKKPLNQFPGWEKVLHPSRPIVTAGETPPLLRGTKQRPHSLSSGGGLVQQPQAKEPGVSATQSEPPLPTSKSEVVWQVTPPLGFIGVTACLWTDQSLEGVCKIPLDPLMIEVILAPTVATMSMSHIVRDEVTGATYMDTMTTLVGWVTLSGPGQEASAQGPTIQDITDLI